MQPHSTIIFNREAFLERIDGDADFLEDLVETFLEYAPSQLQGIQQALTAGDATRVRDEAHSLKGAAASISAEALYEAARQMELAGEQGQLDDAIRLMERVTQEYTRLCQLLEG